MVQKITWEECLEQGIITQTKPDRERARQMKKIAQKRMEFWNQPIKEEHTAFKIEAYYEIIKELIFAHIYEQGYNCTNHLCLIAYLQEKMENFDFETQKIDELRKIRNEISYRGTTIKQDYLERNEKEFKHIINKLQEQLSTL